MLASKSIHGVPHQEIRAHCTPGIRYAEAFVGDPTLIADGSALVDFGGKRIMSASWFYMATGWLRKARRVGPITEQDLLSRIDKGQIQPDTLVQSAKTRNRWVPMSKVGPAMQHWEKLHPEKTTTEEST